MTTMGLRGKWESYGGGRGLVGMGGGHSLGAHRRVGPGMLVGTFHRTLWPRGPSPRWEPAFKECCIPPNPVPQRELWVLDHPAPSQREGCKLSLEKFALSPG